MNNAQNFVLLACVALRQGNTNDAAELMAYASAMEDFDDFLTDGLNNNIEAVELSRSLSSVSSDSQFEGLASSFREELAKAFGSSTSAKKTEESEDDYDIGLSDDDEEDEDDDDFESESSVRRPTSPLSLNL